LYFGDRVAVLNDCIYQTGGSTRYHFSFIFYSTSHVYMLQEHMPREDNTIHAELCTKVQAGYENSKCFTLGHQKLASRCFDKPVTIVLGPEIITIIQIS
jgi:hypothetical protein